MQWKEATCRRCGLYVHMHVHHVRTYARTCVCTCACTCLCMCISHNILCMFVTGPAGTITTAPTAPPTTRPSARAPALLELPDSVTSISGTVSTVRPGGRKRAASAVDDSIGVRVLWTDRAAARVGDAMDTERITDAAVTSSVTSLSATWAPSAKAVMIELLTAGV